MHLKDSRFEISNLKLEIPSSPLHDHGRPFNFQPELCLNFAAHAQTAADAQAAKAIDELLAKLYPSDGPGASVIVIKEGRVLLRTGYGMADMELGVKVEPDMVFRLGSITKRKGHGPYTSSRRPRYTREES